MGWDDWYTLKKAQRDRELCEFLESYNEWCRIEGDKPSFNEWRLTAARGARSRKKTTRTRPG
jgi:hypothetical protein